MQRGTWAPPNLSCQLALAWEDLPGWGAAGRLNGRERLGPRASRTPGVSRPLTHLSGGVTGPWLQNACSCLGWGSDGRCSPPGPEGHTGVCLCAQRWWDGVGALWLEAGCGRVDADCSWLSACSPAYPSSVSLMMSQISMLRAQSSLCREPSVAFSEERKAQVTKACGVPDDKLKRWGVLW